MVLLTIYGLVLTGIALHNFSKPTRQSLPQAFWIVMLVGTGLSAILAPIQLASYHYFFGTILLSPLSIYLAQALVRLKSKFNRTVLIWIRNFFGTVLSSPLSIYLTQALVRLKLKFNRKMVVWMHMTIHQASPHTLPSQMVALQQKVQQVLEQCQQLQQKYQAYQPNQLSTVQPKANPVFHNQQSIEHLKALHRELNVYRQQISQYQQALTYIKKVSLGQALRRIGIKIMLKIATQLLIGFEQNLLTSIAIAQDRARKIIQDQVWDAYQRKAETFTAQQAQLVTLKHRYQDAQEAFQQQVSDPRPAPSTLDKWSTGLTRWLFGNDYIIRNNTRKLRAEANHLWDEITTKVQELEHINDQIARLRQTYQDTKEANRKVISVWAIYDALNTEHFWSEYEHCLNQARHKQGAVIQRAG